MTVDTVTFGIDGKRLTIRLDRTQLKLGSILYVQFSDAQEPVDVSSHASQNSAAYAVRWIAPSEWYVDLTPAFMLQPEFGQRIEDAIGAYISRSEIDLALQHYGDQVRMKYLYKSSELANNPLGLIYTVLERLDFCSRLAQREVERSLFVFHEPLISYLNLTCFDRLDQTAEWVDFEGWLASKRCEGERKAAVSNIPPNTPILETARMVYTEYSKLYGVRSSFFRFLHDVLPAVFRKELLESIEIIKTKNPPGLGDLPPADDPEKEKYLYRRRNDYTHRADFRPSGGLLGRVYVLPVQEFFADYWTTTTTRGWPTALDKAVRAGLAAYLRLSVRQV